MSTIVETCSCGATIAITDHAPGLYAGAWRRNHRHEVPREPVEPPRSDDGGSVVPEGHHDDAELREDRRP